MDGFNIHTTYGKDTSTVSTISTESTVATESMVPTLSTVYTAGVESIVIVNINHRLIPP